MIQEVSWPPPESKTGKTLPNLNEKVHMGRSKRQKMDLELKNFQGSTAHFSSNPFSTGECSAKIQKIMCNALSMFAFRMFAARQDESRGKVEATTENTGDKGSDGET